MIRLYRQLGGKNWTWNIVLAALIFPVPLLVIFAITNSIAITHGSTAAIPAGTICLILGLYLIVAFPLAVIGGITGRRTASDFDAPCRTKKVPREVPQDHPWYKNALIQAFMAGFLPFSAIYIELHYIFNSIWGHKIYTLFGILFLAFTMLFIVTAFITIALLYFQIASEDHRWWWRSFINGGSTGVFIYMYAFFYFFNRSNMTGILQGSYFFCYMFIVSYAFCIMLGAIGFYSSLFFIRHIYKVIKSD